MKKVLKTAALFAIIVGIGVGLSGCNTVRGIGQDANFAGHAIKRTYKRVF